MRKRARKKSRTSMTKNKKVALYFTYSLFICVMVILFVIAYLKNNHSAFFASVSLFTTIFHFTIRFSFANLIYSLIARLCTCDRWWFKEKSFEKRLYMFLAVKKWKNFLPTWNDRDFDVNLNNYDKLLNHICKAEVYHEVCMILSFVPILFSLAVGKFWIFFWTSFFGAIFDGLFVCIQRYNRPRILTLMKRNIIKTGEKK